MTTPYEDFVNIALGKALSADVTLPTADEIPTYTGIGRQVTGKTLGELGIATTSALSGKEPTITAGTSSQYYRGDKSFQTLDTDAVPETATRVYLSPTQKTIATQAASTSTDGYLTSTDWNTFNDKQAALADVITAGTYGNTTQYPVPTFNAKGICTAVALQTFTAGDTVLYPASGSNTVLAANTNYTIFVAADCALDCALLTGYVRLVNLVASTVNVLFDFPVGTNQYNEGGINANTVALAGFGTAISTRNSALPTQRRVARPQNALLGDIRWYPAMGFPEYYNWTGSLTTTRNLILPDKDINFGDLPSVATTDSNTLSAGHTRCRILGGSNNTVGGTDNASIMSHRSILTGTGNTTINCGVTGGAAGTGVTCAGTRNTFTNCNYITLAEGATDNTFTNCSYLIVSANTKGCTFINASVANGDNIPFRSVITGSGSGSPQSCTIKHWLKAETFSDGIPVVAKIVGAAATNDRTILRISTGSYENGNSTHEITIRGTSEINNGGAVSGTIARRFVSVNNRLTGYSPVQPDILYIETVGIDTVQGNGAYSYDMDLPVITITNNGLFLEIAISITSTHASQPEMRFDVEVVSNYSVLLV